MIVKLILQRYPLPLESIKIGSLITDPLHPYEDIENGSTSLSLKTDCTVSNSGPRLESINNSTNTNYVLKLLQSLFFSSKSSATSSETIVVDDTSTYELTNPTSRFKDLTSQEGVQKWIQIQVEEGRIVYLITGIQTTLNQRVENSKNSKLSGSGSISVDPYIAPTNKVSNASDSTLDVGALHSRSKDAELSISTEGERVIAIRIRRVNVNEAGKATVLDQRKKSIWKIVGDQRAETSVEQLVEAVLQEEDDDCGGTTEVLNAGNGDETFVYVALEDSDKNEA
ncbi:MAG: hypothetical protein LQ351_006389 [Letrouitia transgressa]|nr:MAG: hypothetical protein LQ351_006389 [Letrouitia transgressa]